MKSSTKVSSTKKVTTKLATSTKKYSTTKLTKTSSVKSSTKVYSNTKSMKTSSTKSNTKMSTDSSSVTSVTSSRPTSLSVDSSTIVTYTDASTSSTTSSELPSSSIEIATSSEASSTLSYVSSSSSGTSSAASSTPSTLCGPNLLSNSGFEDGGSYWSIFTQGGGGNVITSDNANGPPLLEGTHYLYGAVTGGEPVFYAIQQNQGISAGTFVSCSGWVYFDGNGINTASLYMEVLVNGNLCASHTYYGGGWNKIESNIPLIVDSNDPQIIFRIYVQNPGGSTFDVGMDQLSIRYSPNAVDQQPPCGEVQPGSGVSSSATSSATSSSSISSTDSATASLSSDISSTVTSSSFSSATASATAACKPNLLSNGDFNTGVLDPFSVSVGNGGGVTDIGVFTTGSIPADDGTPFFQLTTTASPQVLFSQQILNIPSGTVLRCAFDIYSPTRADPSAIFSANFQINGQSCASVGGLYVDPWTRFSNFPISTVSDGSVDIELTVSWNNPDQDGLYLGLDNLYVYIDSPETSDLPLCPPSTPNVEPPASSSSTTVQASSSSSSTSAAAASLTGPAVDGYICGYSGSFTITTPSTPSLSECVSDCQADVSCLFVLYGLGSCYIFETPYDPSLTTTCSDNYFAYVQVRDPTASSSTVSSTASSAAPSSTAAPVDPHPCSCTEEIDHNVGVQCPTDHGKCYFGLTIRCQSSFTDGVYNAGYYGAATCVSDCANDLSCPAVTEYHDFCLQYIYSFDPNHFVDSPEDSLVSFLKPGQC